VMAVWQHIVFCILYHSLLSSKLAPCRLCPKPLQYENDGPRKVMHDLISLSTGAHVCALLLSLMDPPVHQPAHQKAVTPQHSGQGGFGAAQHTGGAHLY
jgi:hypothetical protein